MPKTVVQTSHFRRDLLTYILSLAIWPLLFLMLAALTPKPPSLQNAWTSPGQILIVFAVSGLVTIGLGRWLTAPAVRSIRRQMQEAGALKDNESTIFSNFGFDLSLGVLIGAVFAAQYICDLMKLDSASSSIQILLDCYSKTIFAIVALTGLGTGFLLWIFLEVTRIEKALNQKVLLNRYTTRTWSTWALIGIAVVVFVIIRAFHQLFTLGHS